MGDVALQVFYKLYTIISLKPHKNVILNCKYEKNIARGVWFTVVNLRKGSVMCDVVVQEVPWPRVSGLPGP